jgi:hypothetical protein
MGFKVVFLLEDFLFLLFLHFFVDRLWRPTSSELEPVDDELDSLEVELSEVSLVDALVVSDELEDSLLDESSSGEPRVPRFLCFLMSFLLGLIFVNARPR